MLSNGSSAPTLTSRETTGSSAPCVQPRALAVVRRGGVCSAQRRNASAAGSPKMETEALPGDAAGPMRLSVLPTDEVKGNEPKMAASRTGCDVRANQDGEHARC